MQDRKVALFTIEDLKKESSRLLQTVGPEVPGLPEYFE